MGGAFTNPNQNGINHNGLTTTTATSPLLSLEPLSCLFLVFGEDRRFKAENSQTRLADSQVLVRQSLMERFGDLAGVDSGFSETRAVARSSKRTKQLTSSSTWYVNGQNDLFPGHGLHANGHHYLFPGLRFHVNGQNYLFPENLSPGNKSF